MPSLTSQEKLALAMTSAGSMRSLASVLGITHQKLGRWLREGSEGGVKAIPIDPDTIASINQAFSIHRDLSRQQAKIDNIPFDPAAPTFSYRYPLSSELEKLGRMPRTIEEHRATLGDRVFTEHTEHIRRPTREKVIEGIATSGRYYQVSVRSQVDVKSYFKRAAQQLSKLTRPRNIDEIRAKRQLQNVIDAGVKIYPVYTKYVQVGGGLYPEESNNALNKRIREKHEPATAMPGTKLTDEYLYQLEPDDFQLERQQAKQAAAEARKRARARKRGQRSGKSK